MTIIHLITGIFVRILQVEKSYVAINDLIKKDWKICTYFSIDNFTKNMKLLNVTILRV